jgi:catechol 2,3-dioxygenase-like lactoylglutathione lyase family enzyme
MDTPTMRLTSTVLGTPDPPGLAAFYRELLGWGVRTESPEWVVIEPPVTAGDRPTGLAFQLEAHHRPPPWPAGPLDQQMQAHLDIGVDIGVLGGLEGAVSRATALGATVASYQPQDDVRVMLDPAGHPFCLFETS